MNGRWMSGTSLREKKTRAELRYRMSIEVIGSGAVMKNMRWFGPTFPGSQALW